jgi:hypothetical protein
LKGGDVDESYPKSRETLERERVGKITGDDGIVLLGGKSKSEATEGINVNGYLWKATLDNVYFMPLISADPFGGTILTDWFKESASSRERYKLNIFITGTELRADALRVAAFKQRMNSQGNWVDTDVDPSVATEIEDKILLKARELRYASGK